MSAKAAKKSSVKATAKVRAKTKSVFTGEASQKTAKVKKTSLATAQVKQQRAFTKKFVTDLLAEAKRNGQASENGLADNPNCVWLKKVISAIYHVKLLPGIDHLKSSVKGAYARVSDRGDDGSNGLEELNGNSKGGINAEVSERAAYEAERDTIKKLHLQNIRNAMEAGTFVCKCSVDVFYFKNIV